MSTAAGVLSERDRGLTPVVAVARSETTLARLGLGAIALHVLDDSFFQPQPGTSAGDHLVSGLVPFAVLLLVASVYPHLRPGLRASLVATLGLFGIVSGVEAGCSSSSAGGGSRSLGRPSAVRLSRARVSLCASRASGATAPTSWFE
jgi:hypothetical protein